MTKMKQDEIQEPIAPVSNVIDFYIAHLEKDKPRIKML